MPYHFQPLIRFIEESMESAGIQKTLDSGGVTEIKAEEGALAKRVKPLPSVTLWYLGTKYTPS